VPVFLKFSAQVNELCTGRATEMRKFVSKAKRTGNFVKERNKLSKYTRDKAKGSKHCTAVVRARRPFPTREG